MSASTPALPLPSQPAAARLPLRLQLNPTMGDGTQDGTWWPQSRDLDVELADLVDHFPEEHGRINRAVFSRPDWDTAPHRVRVDRGMLHVGSFPRRDTHQIWLSMDRGRRIVLTVTAPETPDRRDGDAPAGGAQNASDPDVLLHWADEGGSFWEPHTVAPSHRP